MGVYLRMGRNLFLDSGGRLGSGRMSGCTSRTWSLVYRLDGGVVRIRNPQAPKGLRQA